MTGAGLLLRDGPQLSKRRTLAACELVLGVVPIVRSLSPDKDHQDLPPRLDMLLDASHVHVCLQWLGDTLILLYACSVTADGITGGLDDLLANPGDLTHSPDRICHSFDAFCILGQGLNGIE